MFQSSFHLILNSFPSLLLRLIWNGSVSFEVCFEFCNSGSILDLWNLTELLNHPAYFPTPRLCLYKLSNLLLTKHDVYNIQCKFHWNRDKYLRGIIQFRSFLLVSKTGFYLLTRHLQKESKLYCIFIFFIMMVSKNQFLTSNQTPMERIDTVLSKTI